MFKEIKDSIVRNHIRNVILDSAIAITVAGLSVTFAALSVMGCVAVIRGGKAVVKKTTDFF